MLPMTTKESSCQKMSEILHMSGDQKTVEDIRTVKFKAFILINTFNISLKKCAKS